SFGSEGRVGHFHHDAAHVLVDEEIVAGELQIVQRPQRIEEEGIATPAREEAVAAGLRHARVPTRRHRCCFDYDMAAVTRFGGLRTLDAPHGRGLRPARGGREAHPICDVGDGIAVRIDLELVQRLGRERLARGGPRRVHDGGRMDVHDQDRLVRLPWLGGRHTNPSGPGARLRAGSRNRDRSNGATWIIHSSVPRKPGAEGKRASDFERLANFPGLSCLLAPMPPPRATAIDSSGGRAPAMGASSSGTRRPWRAQNVSAPVFGDGDMLATTPASLTPTQVERATSGLVSASTSTAPTAGSNHRARTERYSSSAKNRSRSAQDGNVNVNTRLIRGFDPFSTCATTKSQPKAPRWRARIGAI